MITYEEFLEGDVVLEEGKHMTRREYYKVHCKGCNPRDLYIFIAKCIKENPLAHDAKTMYAFSDQ